VTDLSSAHLLLRTLTRKCRQPVVAYEEFGQRIRITALEPAAQWFLKQGAKPIIEKNPVLAFFFENLDSTGISYKTVRITNPPFEDTKASLDARVSKLIGEDEKLRGASTLYSACSRRESSRWRTLSARQTDRDYPEDTACSQPPGISAKASDSRGRKLLFVGPPGTGKTSLALAMSRTMHMPVLEVRLSMVTSQYLGETSKNIDRSSNLQKTFTVNTLY